MTESKMQPYTGMVVRHVKYGTLYVVINSARVHLQIDGPHDGATLIVYMAINNPDMSIIYARPLKDFIDGRFVEVRPSVE